ncbi:3-phosphoshikimate 1-carboxyvinyltransferase [Candidatus Woesearchaeota archaeon]|jgi:pentafunctional AROM polypeptide|nr:3-phosphoshikimate 1-carboxyvinyltransferase [Candidatus Woesearchaeota archaeon]
MKTINVNIPSNKKEYKVLVGSGILNELKNFIKENHKGKRIVIITDDNVNKSHGKRLLLLLSDLLPDDNLLDDVSSNNSPFLISIPAGEESKSREQKQEIEDLMLDEGFGRNSLIIAFGGGVVGDLAGFISSTFNRGIPLIQIPTTLLSMVDSSVGGKTGINTKQGKNLIGTFSQPEIVIADIDFLNTLSDEEFRNGVAEIVKIAIALDEDFFTFLENNIGSLVPNVEPLIPQRIKLDKEILIDIISKSIKLKANVVEKDEQELGLRQVLNLGHTIGHAIETARNFKEKHGFAICTGIVIESKISEILGLISSEQHNKIINLLKQLGLPVNIDENLDSNNLIELMKSDKKNTSNKPKIVLLEKIGKIKNKDNEFSFEIDEGKIKQAIDICCESSVNKQGISEIKSISEKIIEIKPITKLDAEINIPGSKYVANRVLMIAALADGTSILKNVPDNDDINKAIIALKQFGVSIKREGSSLEIIGTGGNIETIETEIHVGESGTLLRFITGIASLAEGKIKITGSKRIQERPIAPLINTLEQLGVNIERLNQVNKDCCPIVVGGENLNGNNGNSNNLKSNKVVIDASLSSQFLSSLLLIAPSIANKSKNDVEIITTGEVVSKSYVDLTISLMETFGVKIERDDYNKFIIKTNQKFNAMGFTIPSDWSSANYFLAAAAIVPGKIKINHLDLDSVHGEAKFVDVLEKMGCEIEKGKDFIVLDGKDFIALKGPNKLVGVEVDMSSMPDSVQTLVAVAAFANGNTIIKNISNISLKESDRINDTIKELNKLGVIAKSNHDEIMISKGLLNGREGHISIIIDPHNDHRMAMSFALIGLKISGIKINNPGCVNKSFPGFWKKLEEIGVEIVK